MKNFDFNDTSTIQGAFIESKIKTIILSNFPTKNKYSFFLNSNIKNLQLENTTFEEFKKTETYKENYNNIENLYIDNEKVDDDERKKANEEIEEEKNQEQQRIQNKINEEKKIQNINKNNICCIKCCTNICPCCCKSKT